MNYGVKCPRICRGTLSTLIHASPMGTKGSIQETFRVCLKMPKRKKTLIVIELKSLKRRLPVIIFFPLKPNWGCNFRRNLKFLILLSRVFILANLLQKDCVYSLGTSIKGVAGGEFFSNQFLLSCM